MSSLSRERWHAVSPYVDRALDLDSDARAVWIASLRESHPQVAADLEELIAETDHVRREQFLEHSPMVLPEAPSHAGETLGSYTLVSPIGRGGMGSVWLARRSDGRFEGSVAIKLLDTSLIGRAGEERFAREGSFLAKLRHPHIAHLIDAGISPAGQPYLVLEHVEGERIDTFCDARQLDVQARVRLFVDVLSAVAHAHANLIVHRDIKPSNVLVSNTAAVKLLDFGIATLLASDTEAREATMLTREGGRALTPEYAAPEQMLGQQITTATDVYALGVLLYVVLCGRHPAEGQTHSPAQLVKAIVDTVPVPPSGAASDAAARQRNTSSDKLRRMLRGDLDTIVAKAMKKAPHERYASVTAFAEDLRRYLNNEPISARPDSLAYRSAKFVQRHAAAVVAAVLVLATIAGLTVFYTRRLAVERDRARLEAQKSAQVTELLTGLLTGADPYDSRARSDVTVRGILDAGAARVEKELAGQPDLQAEILTVMGRVYQRLDAFDKAQPLLERAVTLARSVDGAESARLAQSLNDLGVLAAAKGNLQTGQQYLEEALAIRRRVLGSEHREVAVTLVELGRVYVDQGAADKAEPLLREALEIRRRVLGEEHTETATSMSDLALLLWGRGETDKAEPLFEQVLTISRKVLPPNHPNIATALNNLALMSMARGDFAAAEVKFRETIQLREHWPAAGPAANQTTLANLSAALREQGKYDEAAAAIEKAIAVATPLGDARPLSSYQLHLARLHVDRKRPKEGEVLAREALRHRERLYAKGDWRIGSAKSVLAETLIAQRRYAEAEPLLLDAHATLKDVPGGQGRDARATRARLVALYEGWGRPESAAAYRAQQKRE